MKEKTKNLAQQVRDGLLALPDKVLMETIAEWLDRANEHLQCLDCSDEYRYALGYRVQSDETKQLYSSFDALVAAEPEHMSASWVIPEVDIVRDILSSLSVELFYHTVIPIAGEALSGLASQEKWGFPPSTTCDGYDFLHNLTVSLSRKAL